MAEKEHGEEYYEGVAHVLNLLALGADVLDKLDLPDAARTIKIPLVLKDTGTSPP